MERLLEQVHTFQLLEYQVVWLVYRLDMERWSNFLNRFFVHNIKSDTQSTTIAILNPMFAQHCIGHSSAMLSHSEISYEGHLSKTFDVEEKNELLRIGLLKKNATNKQTGGGWTSMHSVPFLAHPWSHKRVQQIFWYSAIFQIFGYSNIFDQQLLILEIFSGRGWAWVLSVPPLSQSWAQRPTHQKPHRACCLHLRMGGFIFHPIFIKIFQNHTEPVVFILGWEVLYFIPFSILQFTWTEHVPFSIDFKTTLSLLSSYSYGRFSFQPSLIHRKYSKIKHTHILSFVQLWWKHFHLGCHWWWAIWVQLSVWRERLCYNTVSIDLYQKISFKCSVDARSGQKSDPFSCAGTPLQFTACTAGKRHTPLHSGKPL